MSSVLLLSASTVLTAWCGYEAARWTAVQTRDYNTASAARIEASVADSRINTLETVDLTMFLQYISAIANGRSQESTFIYQRFRPEMHRAVDAWLATNPRTNKKAPSSPFAMPQYRLSMESEVRRLDARAKDIFAAATQANENGDNYVRLTVIFAAVSFLAGMSTKFIFPFHILVVIAGFITLVFGLVRMLAFPLR